MATIKDHVSVIEIGVEPIRHVWARLGRQGGGVAATRGGQIPSKDIAALELKAVTEALVRVRSEAIVVALGGIACTFDDCPILEGAAGPGNAIADGIGMDLVEVLHDLKVAAVISDIGESKTCVKAEFTLKGEVPLLNARINIVNWEGIQETGSARLRLIDGIWGKVQRKRNRGHAGGGEIVFP